MDKEKLLLLDKMVNYCCNNLGIERPNKVIIINNDSYTQEHFSFASYTPTQRIITLVIKNRNVADCCRSLSHECYHMYQDDKGMLSNRSGEDGSEHENEANSYSGKIMRKFGRENPQIYNLIF